MMLESKKPVDNNTCTCPLNKRVTYETGEIICCVCGQVVCMASESVETYSYVSKKDEDGRSLTTNSSFHGKIGSNRIVGELATYFSSEDTLEQACELANRFIENRVAAKQTCDVMQCTIADWFKSHIKRLNPPGTKIHHGITKNYREVCLHDLFIFYGVPYVQATDEEKKQEKTYKIPVNDHRRKKRGPQKRKVWGDTCHHPLCPAPKVDRELEPTNGKHWEKYHSKGTSVCDKHLAFTRQNMDMYFDIISERKTVDVIAICPKDGRTGRVKLRGQRVFFVHSDDTECYINKALVNTCIMASQRIAKREKELALNRVANGSK